MAKRFNSGVFVPTNPSKYKGTSNPKYRSAWELTFCQVCDKHPSIIEWAYEVLTIPYQNPFTGLWHKYIPDFLVMYMDASGKKHCELVEIKPNSQAVTEAARSRADKEAVLINEAKWAAARVFCKQRGMKFRIMTEHDLYTTAKNNGKPKKPKTTRKPKKR